MKNRIPNKPNRKKITPEGGEPFFATVEYADEPVEAGTPINKTTLLKDDTAAMLALPQADPTVDDAFKVISNTLDLPIPSNYYGGAVIKVLDASGEAWSNLKITGLPAGTVVDTTDENGQLRILFTTSASVTISFPTFLGVNTPSNITIVPAKQKWLSYEASYTKMALGTVVDFDASQSISVYKDLELVDLFLVGGGGGGGASATGGGGGGGGGMCETSLNQNVAAKSALNIVIGDGGSVGYGVAGGTGGSTSILDVAATGGFGGGRSNNGGVGGNGGSGGGGGAGGGTLTGSGGDGGSGGGNGSRATGTGNGTGGIGRGTTTRAFGEPTGELYAGGGGGGAGPGTSYVGGLGGAGGGGNGVKNGSNPQSTSGLKGTGGGGGGGGYSSASTSFSGSVGGSGIVKIRIKSFKAGV